MRICQILRKFALRSEITDDCYFFFPHVLSFPHWEEITFKIRKGLLPTKKNNFRPINSCS